MQSKTLSFSKIEKTISKIDNKINDLLETVNFKFATQNQSHVRGKMVVTIFFDKGPSTVRAKAFKDQDDQKLDGIINEFIKDKKVIFTTQSFIGSNIYTILYYSVKEVKETPPTGNKPTDTTPTESAPSPTDVTVTVDKSVGAPVTA